MDSLLYILVFVVGGAIGYLLKLFFIKRDKDFVLDARQKAQELLESAEKESLKRKKEVEFELERLKQKEELKLKEELLKKRTKFEKELNARRNEIHKLERRVSLREEKIEQRMESLDKRESELRKKELEIENLKKQHEEIIQQERQTLNKIASMSQEQARKYLLSLVEKEMSEEIGRRIKDFELEYKLKVDKIARTLIASAVQKLSVDYSAEIAVSTVALPSDEMKGRIIGREGRNIRTFENLTGVDLIIDDTPDAVVLSSFDALRREIARLTLEKLVLDGRIHPKTIEDTYQKVLAEFDKILFEEGEKAAYELQIHNLHPELLKILGKLKYRTSYGQNVLLHSIEVAHIAGIIATELGLDVNIAKRAGLLHDIGKASGLEIEGPHALVGAKLAAKYGESDIIVNAIASHHNEEEPNSVEAVIIAAADAISAARPGARKETLESYIKRLKDLENIAEGMDGVHKAYAVQAGRELRVIVDPESLSDDLLYKLAKDIRDKIQETMTYPGQIKVIVIREKREMEIAK